MRAKQDQMESTGFFLRLSPDQRAAWELAARRQGFGTLAKFVRAAVDQAADEGLKITAEDRRAIGNVREQVRRIGVNLNMVAAALNALADAPELAERWRAKLIRTEEELAGEIRAAVVGVQAAYTKVDVLMDDLAHRLQPPPRRKLGRPGRPRSRKTGRG